MPLYRPQELISFLKTHGLEAKKGLSQNFLIDKTVLKKIVDTAEILERDTVLEIGPGPGALTEMLLATGAKVIAIEKDRDFARLLPRLAQDTPFRLRVYEDDALSCSIENLIPPGTKVVANLPYQITAPLLGKLLPLYPHLHSLTIMVQKEVAERMTAKPGGKIFGHFSVFCQSYGNLSYCFTVKNRCFLPSPKVDSAVVHCKLCVANNEKMEQFINFSKKCFQHKRKTLRANLKFHYPQDAVEKLMDAAALAPTIRAEQLCPDELLALWEQFSRIIN